MHHNSSQLLFSSKFKLKTCKVVLEREQIILQIPVINWTVQEKQKVSPLVISLFLFPVQTTVMRVHQSISAPPAEKIQSYKWWKQYAAICGGSALLLNSESFQFSVGVRWERANLHHTSKGHSAEVWLSNAMPFCGVWAARIVFPSHRLQRAGRLWEAG